MRGPLSATRRRRESLPSRTTLAVDELAMQHAVAAVTHDRFAGIPVSGAHIRRVAIVERFARDPVALAGQRDLPAPRRLKSTRTVKCLSL